jgi:hypothetical protein
VKSKVATTELCAINKTIKASTAFI